MTPKKKIIIASSIFVAVAVLLIIITIIFQSTQKNATDTNQASQNSYYDADSGETVYNPDNRTPEGLSADGAIILGFSSLLDIGLSSHQLELTMSYMRQYSLAHTIDSQPIDQISLVRQTSKQMIDPTSGQKDITAEIKINRTTTQKVTLSYISLNDLLLRISDRDGLVLYTSPYDE